MNEIPQVSDELMDQVNRIFYHGERRAKSHDLRFGQWLINNIRRKYPDGDVDRILFNMENPEILEMLRDYND